MLVISNRYCPGVVGAGLRAAFNAAVACASVIPLVSYGLQTKTGAKSQTTSSAKPATADAVVLIESVPPKNDAGRMFDRVTGATVTSTNLALAGSVVTFAAAIALASLAGRELR